MGIIPTISSPFKATSVSDQEGKKILDVKMHSGELHMHEPHHRK